MYCIMLGRQYNTSNAQSRLMSAADDVCSLWSLVLDQDPKAPVIGNIGTSKQKVQWDRLGVLMVCS